jgi:hypothetical protein
VGLVALQLIAFVALGVRIVAMVQGAPAPGAPRTREGVGALAPAVGLLGVALAIGLLPAVQHVLLAAAGTLGGTRP